MPPTFLAFFYRAGDSSGTLLCVCVCLGAGCWYENGIFILNFSHIYFLFSVVFQSSCAPSFCSAYFSTENYNFPIYFFYKHIPFAERLIPSTAGRRFYGHDLSVRPDQWCTSIFNNGFDSNNSQLVDCGRGQLNDYFSTLMLPKSYGLLLPRS